MNARKNQILEILQTNTKPVSASAIATMLGVSRQIIVGDIALLRASGHEIHAMARGYVLANKSLYVITCKHDLNDLQKELYTIIDCGCGIIDVIIYHEIYGKIVGKLNIYSKKDADQFLAQMENNGLSPLSEITNGIHSHTLSCPTLHHFEDVKAELKDILIEMPYDFTYNKQLL